MDSERQSFAVLTAFSPIPSKPCLLLSFPSCKILFDSAVDFSPMNFYAPCSIVPKIGVDLTDYSANENVFEPTTSKRSRYNSEGLYHGNNRKMDVDDVKPKFRRGLGRPDVSVDAVPEVNFVFNPNVDLTTIDAFFISNWDSLKALPFLVEKNELGCPIYATDPVITLGSLVIEDLIHFFERTDKKPDDKKWVDLAQWDNYVGEDPRKSLPHQWRSFYNEQSLKNTMSRITKISPNQPIKVGNNLTVRLYQSGYEIGSSNWLIEVGDKKIGYFAATSTKNHYVHEPIFKSFEKLDALILTSLREINSDPKGTIADMCAKAVDILKSGGNVLFPMSPIGNIYDIVESLIGRMDLISPNSNYPIYIFSNISSKGLAFTNVAGEWFCADRREKLFTPNQPFKMDEFIAKKRVFLYDSIHSAFAKEYRMPCVAFTSHSSLRIGDSTYFLDLWGNNSKNAVILTDPDFDFEPTWSPFTTKMKAYWYPVDMRLSPFEVNEILSKTIKTEKLIVPVDYVEGNQNVLKHNNIVTFEPSLPLKMLEVDERIEFICFSDEIAEMTKVSGRIMNGYMNHIGTDIQLSAQKEPESSFMTQLTTTSEKISALKFKKSTEREITLTEFMKSCEKENIKMSTKKTDDGSMLVILEGLDAEIQFTESIMKIKCSNSESRKRIQKIFNFLKNDSDSWR